MGSQTRTWCSFSQLSGLQSKNHVVQVSMSKTKVQATSPHSHLTGYYLDLETGARRRKWPLTKSWLGKQGQEAAVT